MWEKKAKKFDSRKHDRLKSIWQKDLIVLKLTRVIQCYERDKTNTNQKRNDQNEHETKQSRQIWNDYEWRNLWLENRLQRFEAKDDQRNRLQRFEVWTIIIFLLLSYTNDVKNHFKYLSHVLTWKRDDVWIKQTNKQTNHRSQTNNAENV